MEDVPHLWRCRMPCRPSGHYHCPYCSRTVIRRVDMERHLALCRLQRAAHDLPAPPLGADCPPPPQTTATYGLTPPPPVADCPPPPLKTATSPANVHATSQDHSYACSSVSGVADVCGKSAKCPHCSLSMLKKNFSTHMLRKHSNILADITMGFHLPSVLVDQTNGIFAVRRTGHGFSVPVHVQRKTWGKTHKVLCELDECQQFQLLAQRSGLSHSLCVHLRSIDYCDATGREAFLQKDVLDEMVGLKFFGEAKAAVCLRRQRSACEAHVPLCVPVNFGGSSSQICTSIHEPTIHSFSRLGRLMVTFNCAKNTWHCPCRKPRTSCPHINIAKWHCFQTNKQLFTSDTQSASRSEGSSQQDTTAVKRTAQYILKEKKIPQPLPKAVMSLTTNKRHLFPVENECQLCAEHPLLGDAVLITNRARIVGIMGLLENISTYQRQCPQCKMTYRYQEWKDGLHNFDNHLLLSLELCLFLRENICNHVSVSRVVDSLQGLREEKYPSRDAIFHGYCHFEALTDTEYDYTCVTCGFHPPVVVMDLHRKGVFKLEVSDLKAPEEYNGEQDIDSFWNSVHLDMISRGFFTSGAKNPFVVKPSYDHWAPWIGAETRQGGTVLNTEFKKLRTAPSAGEAQLHCVSEDRLIDELAKQKVGVVRKLCKSCNVDTKGSRLDLINRLREHMKSRHTFDKVFQSIWGASGGCSVILCPHGVVYSIKFNLRAESPRDFADLLLSWKHFPNVSIYDFARGLATHTNLRVPEQLPFQPHEGRLADPTEENIKAAMKGSLTVSLPWLQEKLHKTQDKAHPLTGSSAHYCLYDRFHEDNASDPKDRLRRIGMVPELKGWLNSQVVEQFFAKMRKNNYFMNNMNPSTHIFLMRHIIHRHNTATNNRLLEKQLTAGHQLELLHSVTLSTLGQAVICKPVTDKASNSDYAGSAHHCGQQCEMLTAIVNLRPCRASWGPKGEHPLQEQLVNYILDESGPPQEIMVKDGPTCLTRENLLSLGLNREMDSVVGNACLRLVKEMSQLQGKNVFIMDLHIPPTWLPPRGCDPLLSLPVDATDTVLVFPLWTPGHYLLCVMKPLEKRIWFLDSQYAQREQSFGHTIYRDILRLQ
ncbi:uncharacterized protein LOC110159374 [Boleophthalmus pectinirostris]|uniref:uncharacterized protein LOC110159374 n=1 Tax=Boleophthalmus pectinirostris TaxID=150288 RepID=UPI0024315AD5|nr:uncharacterized protein LOC110159374 [Boleophthalmus pectinirostris]